MMKFCQKHPSATVKEASCLIFSLILQFLLVRPEGLQEKCGSFIAVFVFMCPSFLPPSREIGRRTWLLQSAIFVNSRAGLVLISSNSRIVPWVTKDTSLLTYGNYSWFLVTTCSERKVLISYKLNAVLTLPLTSFLFHQTSGLHPLLYWGEGWVRLETSAEETMRMVQICLIPTFPCS